MESLIEKYKRVRRFTENLAEPLTVEDCSIQSMPDASPTRWHLAHTTWFFETFILKEDEGYQSHNSEFEYLFNSYYNTVGKQFPRSQRGMISRPNLNETLEYRQHVDKEMQAHFNNNEFSDNQLNCIEIGLNHEQQHQELILTDIKHGLSINPLKPAYKTQPFADCTNSSHADWIAIKKSTVDVGHQGDSFCFDNEKPRHSVIVNDFELATQCVTNKDFRNFIEDGGYQRPEFWLSQGWATVQNDGWQHPLYWLSDGTNWQEFTLAGVQPINENFPVCHVSYFEADAYARWAGFRLPTEFEWEAAASAHEMQNQSTIRNSDQFVEGEVVIHPTTDQVWHWTSSQYSAYPGYRPDAGALGEYNGKFMCNQFVLRGGSCATPSGHIRNTYRNFFPPEARWQFSGIRLAR